MEDAEDTIATSELQDAVAALSLTIRLRVRILEGLIAVVSQHESASIIRQETQTIDAVLGRPLALLMQAAASSAMTALELAGGEPLKVRDIYGVARTVVELATNICYIIAVGNEAVFEAQRSAIEMAQDDLDRRSAIGESSISVSISDSGVTASFSEAEGARGKRKKKSGFWGEMSIDRRIEIVGEACGKQILGELHMGRFVSYRHSSEILHGSYFGVQYFWGNTLPNQGQLDMAHRAEWIQGQKVLLLLSITCTLNAVILTFHSKYGFQSAVDESAKADDVLFRTPYFRTSKR